MRTIIYASISALVAVTAVQALNISSGHSARHGVPANFESQADPLDSDSEDHGGMEAPRYLR